MIKDLKDVEKVCKEIKEYQRILEETTALIDSLKDEIKDFMGDETELIAGEYKVKWTPVAYNRFDQSKFKGDHPDLFQVYTKITETRRFSIG